MTNRPIICLHADSNGDIWSLQAGKDVVKPKFNELPAADYWVVGFPENYAILTELYFDTVRRYKVKPDNLSHVYVGSTFPWLNSIAKSKYFLYDLAVIPSCKRQSCHWHLLDDNSINTYLLARGFYDNIPEAVEIAWQDHCLSPIFSALGSNWSLDPAMHFIVTLVEPRWLIPPNGSLQRIERYFGLKANPSEAERNRFRVLHDALKVVPTNNFLYVEAKARKVNNKIFELARLFLHFVVRHWLSFQTKLEFFDEDVFFKSQQATQMYLSSLRKK